MRNNVDKTFASPKLFWQSRPEYQVFELKKFRDHIQQERRSKKESNYWLIKKKKKSMGIIEYGSNLNDEEFFNTYTWKYLK